VLYRTHTLELWLSPNEAGALREAIFRFYACFIQAANEQNQDKFWSLCVTNITVDKDNLTNVVSYTSPVLFVCCLCFYNLFLFTVLSIYLRSYFLLIYLLIYSVAEWLACWTQTQKARVQIAVATLSCNSLRQTAHTHCASVHQAAKLVAALLRVAGVTAGLAESNGSLPPGLWLTSPAGWLLRTRISSGTLRSVIQYGLPLPFYHLLKFKSQNLWQT